MSIRFRIFATLFAVTATAGIVHADEDTPSDDSPSVSDEPGTKTVDDTAPIVEVLRQSDPPRGETEPSGSQIDTDRVIKNVPSSN